MMTTPSPAKSQPCSLRGAMMIQTNNQPMISP